MPQFYLRNCFLWTCFSAIAIQLFATAPPILPPPLLSNPSGCNLGLPIKDFSCDASHFFEIDVTTAPGTSLGVDVYLKEVRLIINHQWAADLDVTLISPNDVAINLTSDNGSGQDNYGNPLDCSQFTTFISSSSVGACSSQSISSGTAPFIGIYLSESDFLPMHDGTNPINRWVLQVCDDGKEHEGTLEYVELVFEPLACLNPTDVTVVAVDSNTVLLDWTPGLFCDSTIIELVPNGFTPGSTYIGGSSNSIVVVDSCPPVLVQGHGLLPSTAYEVYIREKCPAGFSINTCPVGFVTTCSPPNITLKEDFNAQINCTAICGVPCPIDGLWSNALTDDFDWIVSDKNNITTSGTGPSDDNPGDGKYIYIESSQSLCRGGREGMLISNCMRVKAGADSCDMSYDFLLYGPHVNALKLEYKETDSLEWQLLDVVAGNQGNKWVTRFIDLDPLNGKSVQFRFLALGGNGPRGDIALDNITFFGSEDLGPPPFVYYRDQDGDGYGGAEIYFSTCSFQANTPGFVPNDLDCDDLDPDIFPNNIETPCNGYDQNCNGDADEFDFAPPIALDTTICSGVIVPFKAAPRFGGDLIWYSDALGMDSVFTGNEFFAPTFPTNFGSDPINVTYFAKERVSPVCSSSLLTPVVITILPQADIHTTDIIEVCEGQPVDLSAVDVIDNNGTNGVITYHSANPISPTNAINPIVFPPVGSAYYIASTPTGGCADVVEIQIHILSTPNAEITGQGAVCKETAQTLSALDLNGITLPLTYSWNIGETGQNIDIESHPNLDSTDHYAVTITASNGCSSTDLLPVTTIANIHQVFRKVTDVTVCEGSDGAIKLVPLDGIAPFTFYWGNGMTFTGDSLVLTNLPQSSFSFTIIDNSVQKCPFVIPGMTVNGPGAVVVSSQVAHVSCNGLADGCISLNINGTAPVITWQDGSHGPSFCNLSAGLYEVTITDGDCENILDFEVKQPNKLIVNPTIVSPTCHGSTNGSIEMNVFGGTPPYQFDWLNGLETQKINNLAAGNYPLTISDSKGCIQAFPSLNVTEPSAISFDTTSIFLPTCFGLNDGKIGIKPSGGTSPYDVDWSNGAMGTTANSLASGTYEVSIEDANGCVFIQPILLEQPLPLNLTVDDIVDPSCKGLSDGEIYISADGGTGNLVFDWSNTGTDEDIKDLPEGDYFVSVTDANQCLYISDAISLIGPELLAIDATAFDPPCVGKNEGEICIQNNPTNFYFDWSIDESGPCIQGLSPGCYSVTMTEISSGCQVDSTFCLTTAQKISVNINKTPPACNGQANGFISLIATGLAPLSYHWGDIPDDTPNRNLLPAGNYFASITDAEGCILSTGDILLEEPEPISIELLTLDMPVCHADSTGTIEVVASGGTGNLHYSWTSGDTLPLLNGLGQGLYSLTVNDEKSCAANKTYQVTWPQPLVLKEKRFFSGCHSLDSVCVEVTGGVGAYSYSWGHGDSIPCLIDVPVGDYGVTVTDGAGCTEELMSIKITDDASPIFLQSLPSKDSICFGETNGELSVLVDGGAFPYQYIWDNGNSGNSVDTVLVLENIDEGYYSVTITDNDGCIAVSPTMQIIEGPPFSSSISTVDVNCKEGSDGEINLSVNGSFPPYQYVWTGPNASPLFPADPTAIVGLEAGEYFVQIIDNQNCMHETNALVTEPPAHLGLLSFYSDPVTCFGDSDGEIGVVAMGGTPPYEYEWASGDTTQNITGLAAGTYSLLMTDANACAYLNSFLVGGPDQPLGLDFFDIAEPFCFGYNDGSIDVDMGGGTPPYSYDWGMSNQEDLMNIGADEYHLTVIDGTMKCTFDTTFIVNEPPLFEADTMSTPATNNNANGTATAIPSGGTAPYQYFWETGDTTQTITGLLPGWYTFVVTDDNFCETTGGVMVGNFTGVFDPEIITGFAAYPNPTAGLVTLDLQLAEPLDIEVKLFNTLGELVFFENKPLSANNSWLLDLQALPAGIYQVLLKNGETLLATERILKY